MVASSGVSATSWARVFQVPQASPVKAMAEVWSDHGPAGYTSSGSSLDAADAGQHEAPLALVDHLLGVEMVDPRVGGEPRHGHARRVAAPVEPPERHALLLKALLEGEVGLGLGDRAPVPDLAGPGRAASTRPASCPAMRSASASSGSLSSMLEWMFKVTSMPWAAAQSRNAPGSGKRPVFHSQPSQSLGAFQSVSSDRVLRGTWFCLEGRVERVSRCRRSSTGCSPSTRRRRRCGGAAGRGRSAAPGAAARRCSRGRRRTGSRPPRLRRPAGVRPSPAVVHSALWVSSSRRQPARSSRPSVCSGSKPTWHVSPRLCPGAQVGRGVVREGVEAPDPSRRAGRCRGGTGAGAPAGPTDRVSNVHVAARRPRSQTHARPSWCRPAARTVVVRVDQGCGLRWRCRHQCWRTAAVDHQVDVRGRRAERSGPAGSSSGRTAWPGRPVRPGHCHVALSPAARRSPT